MYWKRFALAYESLQRQEGSWSMTVATSDADPKAPACHRLRTVADASLGHRKAALLRAAIERTLDDPSYPTPDWIAFVDADVIYPPGLTSLIAQREPQNRLLSGLRAHLSEPDTDSLLLKGRLPDEEILASMSTAALFEERRSSPYMGWLQVFSLDLLGVIPFNKYENHDGYDKFDYETSVALRQACETAELLPFSRYPLHLYHGWWGQNWNGVSAPL